MDDLSRPVCVSRTLHLELANTRALPVGYMENVPVNNLIHADSCEIECFCNAVGCGSYHFHPIQVRNSSQGFPRLYSQVFRGAQPQQQRIDQSQVRPLPSSLQLLLNVQYCI